MDEISSRSFELSRCVTLKRVSLHRRAQCKYRFYYRIIKTAIFSEFLQRSMYVFVLFVLFPASCATISNLVRFELYLNSFDDIKMTFTRVDI